MPVLRSPEYNLTVLNKNRVIMYHIQVIVQTRVRGPPSTSKHREELKVQGEAVEYFLTNYEVF